MIKFSILSSLLIAILANEEEAAGAKPYKPPLNHYPEHEYNEHNDEELYDCHCEDYDISTDNYNNDPYGIEIKPYGHYVDERKFPSVDDQDNMNNYGQMEEEEPKISYKSGYEKQAYGEEGGYKSAKNPYKLKSYESRHEAYPNMDPYSKDSYEKDNDHDDVYGDIYKRDRYEDNEY